MFTRLCESARTLVRDTTGALRTRIRALVLGSTLALATVLLSQLGQSCATTGQ
jgi:hypothetical protein